LNDIRASVIEEYSVLCLYGRMYGPPPAFSL
jgi:hypothetical protein